MSRRERDELGLDVEELELDAWGQPAAAPPGARRPASPTASGSATGWGHGPPAVTSRDNDVWTATTDDAAAAFGRRARSWLRGRGKQVGVAVGAVAVFAAAVAIATGPGGDPGAEPTTPPPSTAAPSTTARRPVTTPPTTAPAVPAPSDGSPSTPTVDYRFALGEMPAGFEVADASVITPDVVWGRSGGTTLFAADDATWSDGPWLQVLTDPAESGTAYTFSRPPTSVPIGDVTGRVGSTWAGRELTMFTVGTTTVSVVGLGLAPRATVAVAERLSVAGGTAVVPADALPAGLRARPDLDAAHWEFGWQPATQVSVSFQDSEREAWLSFTAGPPSDHRWIDSAGFFLSDVRYLMVRGATGVAGRRQSTYGGDPAAWATWTRDGHEYVAFATGIDVDELLTYVGDVVQVGDPGWDDARWQQLLQAASQCCTYVDSGPTVSAAVATASADGAWRATIDVGAQAGWLITRDLANNATYGFGVGGALEVPTLAVQAVNDWWSNDQAFRVMVAVLVDRSMRDASLRLVVGGTEPQQVQTTLTEVAGTPYLSAAAVLPWADGGFSAQLVGPDGQVLAIRTDADLP